MTNKFKIIVDSRENKPWSFNKTSRCEGSEVQALSTGDYSIKSFEDKFAIERKASVSELAKNLHEQRWFNCLRRLSSYDFSCIICEFNMSDIMKFPVGSSIPRRRWRFLKVKPSFIVRHLSIIQIKFGVSVFLADNASYAQDMALSLMKRFIDDIK